MSAATRLEGRIVLVTGGAVRLGAAISRAVAAAGAAVAIHCHTHGKEAEVLADELRADGAAVHIAQADLRRADEVARLFDRVETAMGRVSGLVNNAGIIAGTPLDDFDASAATGLFELNAMAPLLTTAQMARRAAPGDAAIVNIVDSAVDRAWAGHAAYIASKAALEAATRVAARELAPRIRVNGVSPGTVALRPDETERVRALEAGIPLGRVGTPEDVADAVVFLLAAPYITGAILPVDGGRRLAR